MYYSELVNKACNLMFEAHQKDYDKGGYPYVFHPFYLATRFDDEDLCSICLLHDLIEDHGDIYSFEDLEVMGFNEKIIAALKLLTHQDNVEYMDYVHAIGENELARKVKIEDLKHNLDTRRVNGVKAPKYDLYLEALEYLERKGM